MEPWQGKLAANEIEDVIAYVRSLARRSRRRRRAPRRRPRDAGRDESVREAARAPLSSGATPRSPTSRRPTSEKRRFVLIDARPTSDYLRMHIPGAISVPYFDMHDLDRCRTTARG
jgi:hypothetical protein